MYVFNLIFLKLDQLKNPKHILIGLIICIVLIFIGGLQIVLAANQSVTIKMTDATFIPNAIMVEEGTAIRWLNTGKSSRWPAANDHPTHTRYPGSGPGCIGSQLDACKALSPNDSFTFVFDKQGSWGIHDHISPGLVMSVTVIPKQSLPQKLLALGKQWAKAAQPAKLSVKPLDTTAFIALNYAGRLSHIRQLANYQPKLAWQVVKEATQTAPDVMGNAHEFAHIVGNAAYTKLGMSGMGVCDEAFGFGCFHGVSEQMLKAQGKAATTAIQEACVSQFPPNESLKYASCIHGIGHGLLSYENLQLRPALSDCDVLDPQYRQYCYDGVFMELQTSQPINATYSQNDPWKLCLSFVEQHQMGCVRNLMVPYYSTGSSLTAAICDKAPNKTLQEVCYKRFGFTVVSYSQGRLEDIRKNCQTIFNQYYQSVCVTSAATEIIFQQYPNWPQVAKLLCDGLPATEASTCIASNQKTIVDYQRTP